MTDELQYCMKCEYIQEAKFRYPNDKMTFVSHRCGVDEHDLDYNQMVHMAQVGCRTRKPPKKGIIEEEGR